MNPARRALDWWVIGGFSIILLVMLILMPATPMNIDEIVYLAGTKALAGGYGLTIPNGFTTLPFDDLKMWLLVDGPSGLVTQYPSGSAILAAPFYILLGTRGLILVNMLAAIATLIVVRALALTLYDDRRIALAAMLLLVGATFWTEYALAIWPHAVSVLAASGAFLCLAVAMTGRRGRSAGEPVFFILAGLCAGLGLLVRVDALLLVPPMFAIILLIAARPVEGLWRFTLGFLPPLGAAMLLNLYKFGTLNPLSYGKSGGGGTDPLSHLPAIGLVAAAGLAMIAWRFAPKRPPLGISLGVGAALVAAAMWLAPPVARLAGDYLSGLWGLGVDARSIEDARAGVVEGPGGTLLFWGFAKKALLQSLPWLAILVVLPALARTRRERTLLGAAALIVLGWSLPFFVRAWHGGLGGNMRYLMPLLPVFALLGGRVLVALGDRFSGHRPWLYGLVGGTLILLLGARLLPGDIAYMQQPGALALAIAVLIAGLAYLFRPSVRAAQIAAVAAGGGLAFAGTAMTVDLAAGSSLRAAYANEGMRLADIPAGSLVVGTPEPFAGRLFGGDLILAMPNRQDGTVQPALIDSALGEGRRVFVHMQTARRMALEGRMQTAPGDYVEIVR